MKNLRILQAAVCVLGIALFSLLLPDAIRADQRPARFTVVLGGAGVRDNQTGLIW